ncbi:cell wall-binding repeat-containing protein, partial [Euzebya rosea]|uniref:cell wall-binding repeat-containing protein n=1 Tax=Euzebya rosea TaxID=2052804 RepID=UPI00147405D6
MSSRVLWAGVLICALLQVVAVGPAVLADAGPWTRASSGGAATEPEPTTFDQTGGCLTDAEGDVEDLGDGSTGGPSTVDITRWCADLGADGIALSLTTVAASGTGFVHDTGTHAWELVTSSMARVVNVDRIDGELAARLYEIGNDSLVCTVPATINGTTVTTTIPSSCIGGPSSMEVAAFVYLADGDAAYYDEHPDRPGRVRLDAHAGPASLPAADAGPPPPSAGDPPPPPTEEPPPVGPAPTVDVPAGATRIDGGDDVATSVMLARRAFPHGADRLYLAREDLVADALAAAPLADGPVVLVPPCGTPPRVVVDLVQDLGAGEVTALGGTSAICESLLVDLAGGRSRSRLWGPSRYDTAATIALTSHPDGSDLVYVAAGEQRPDAVVGGTMAGGPMLLVPGAGPVPDVVADALDDLSPSRVVVLGGSAAVSDGVVGHLADWAPVTRLWGPTRLTTAAAISEFGFGLSARGDFTTAAYLVGHDELATAVATGSVTDGPILLVDTCGTLDPAVQHELGRLLPAEIVAVGDAPSVCNATLEAAVAAATPPPPRVAGDVVALESREARVMSATADTVVLERTTRSAGITAGNLVALEPDPDVLPGGWVVEVLAVTTNTDTVVLGVKAAEIGDVLEDGVIRSTPAQRSARASERVVDFGDLGCSTAKPENCTDAQIRIDGSMAVSFDPFFDINTDQSSIETGVRMSIGMDARFAGRSGQSYEQEYGRIDLPKLPVGTAISFGPFALGVIFVPTIVVGADVSGHSEIASARITYTSAERVVGFRAGLDGIGLTGVAYESDTSGFRVHDGINLSGQAQFRPFAKLEGALLIGVGPLDSRRILSGEVAMGIRMPWTLRYDSPPPSAIVATVALEAFGSVSGRVGRVELSHEVSGTLLGPYEIFRHALAEQDMPDMRDRVIRVPDGRSWYVDESNVRHHIPDGGTYLCLTAWKGKDVVQLTSAQADQLAEGAAASCVVTAARGHVIRQPDGTTHYVDDNSVRHWIPNGGTYLCLTAWKNKPVMNVTNDQANALTEGTHQ